jgi:hypothetical protein
MILTALAVGVVGGTVWAIATREEAPARADLATLNSTASPAVAYANGKMLQRALETALPAWSCVAGRSEYGVAVVECSTGEGASLQMVRGHVAARGAGTDWPNYVKIWRDSMAGSSPDILMLSGKRWFVWGADEQAMIDVQATLGGRLSRPWSSS